MDYYRIISLTQGKATKVDTEDYTWLRRYKWHFCKGYVVRNSPGTNGYKKLYMHREILIHHGANMDGLETDHKNLDKLDNRKQNLRSATRLQNARNRSLSLTNVSGYHGVASRPHGKWTAQISVNKHIIYLGTFDNPVKAAQVYDIAAKKHHGEFASLNFPGGGHHERQSNLHQKQ